MADSLSQKDTLLIEPIPDSGFEDSGFDNSGDVPEIDLDFLEFDSVKEESIIEPIEPIESIEPINSSKAKISAIIERIRKRKDPDFIDKMFRSIRRTLVENTDFFRVMIDEPTARIPTNITEADAKLARALETGNVESVEELLKSNQNLEKIKKVYSLKKETSLVNQGIQSFLENILPEYIDNKGDKRTIRIQEEVNAILQKNGEKPIDFNNKLSFSELVARGLGSTLGILPYYYLGGALISPFRAASVAKIIGIGAPKVRTFANVVSEIGHTAAAFTAADVLHEGFDPKSMMLNGVAQGSGEAIGEMILAPVLNKFLSKTGSIYVARMLATSTTEFFQELVGQALSTGKPPDLTTIGVTAAISGVFGLAARQGMQTDILHVYENAVKERSRLLKKRNTEPDSFNEKDLEALNLVNNTAEAIKFNALNWGLKDQFKNFTDDRRKKKSESFQLANAKLKSLSKLSAALAEEIEERGISEDPQELINFLESKGFTEEEILSSTPEDIINDPRIITTAQMDNLIENYRDIFAGIGDLQDELENPEASLTWEELFGETEITSREIGIPDVKEPALTEKELGIEEEVKELALIKKEEKLEKVEKVKEVSRRIKNEQGKELFAGVVGNQVVINDPLLTFANPVEVLENQEKDTLKELLITGDYAALINTAVGLFQGEGKKLTHTENIIRQFLVEHEKAHLAGIENEKEANKIALEKIGVEKVLKDDFKEWDKSDQIEKIARVEMAKLVANFARTGKEITLKDLHKALIKRGFSENQIRFHQRIPGGANIVSFSSMFELNNFGKYLEETFKGSGKFKVKGIFKDYTAENFFNGTRVWFKRKKVQKTQAEVPKETPTKEKELEVKEEVPKVEEEIKEKEEEPKTKLGSQSFAEIVKSKEPNQTAKAWELGLKLKDSEIEDFKQEIVRFQEEEANVFKPKSAEDFNKKADLILQGQLMREALSAKTGNVYGYSEKKGLFIQEGKLSPKFQQEIDKLKKEIGIFGKENKIFTEEGKNKALERLKKKGGQLRTGIDPSDLKDLINIAGFYAEGGIRKTSEILNKLSEEVGDWVRVHSRAVIDGIKKANISIEDDLEQGKVERQKFVRRSDLRENPNKIYLFGDNLQQKGFGGQAKEMRGEPNAIGIPTKKRPSNTQGSFFTDSEFESNKKAIDNAFAKIPSGKTVVVPTDGLGTGLASLEGKAPKTFEYLQSKIRELEGKVETIVSVKSELSKPKVAPVSEVPEVEIESLTGGFRRALLRNGIRYGKITNTSNVKTVLEKIKSGKSEKQKVFATFLLQNLTKHDEEVKVYYLSSVTLINRRVDGIHIKPEGFNNLVFINSKLSSHDQNESFLHESVHLIIDKVFKKTKRNVDEELFYSEITRLRGLARKAIKGYDYAFKNNEEFVANAFTHVKFQGLLSKLPDPKRRNILSSFFDSIKKLLGIRSGTVLDTTFDEVFSILGFAFEPEVAKPKTGKKLEIQETISRAEFDNIQSDVLPDANEIESEVNTKDLITDESNIIDRTTTLPTEKDITVSDLPYPDSAPIEHNTDNVNTNSNSDVSRETDGRNEQNVTENNQDVKENGLIVTKIVNEKDVVNAFTASSFLAGLNIALHPLEIEMMAKENKDSFIRFKKDFDSRTNGSKLSKNALRRIWFKSKDKAVRNNIIYTQEKGGGLEINVNQTPDGKPISRFEYESKLDRVVKDYNKNHPNDTVDLFYFEGFYTIDTTKRTEKKYYKKLSNADKGSTILEKQKLLLKDRFIFFTTASDASTEAWFRASLDVWGRFSSVDEAREYYNKFVKSRNLPDFDTAIKESELLFGLSRDSQAAQYLASSLYYFNKAEKLLKTGLSDANFTKRAQIFMSRGGHLDGVSFKAEFKDEDLFYSFNKETGEIAVGEKGEKEGHDGAVYVTLSKMIEIANAIGEPEKRIMKPFYYGTTKDGKTVGLKFAMFVATPKMEAEMRKKGVNTLVYLSSEKMGQVKSGEIHELNGTDMVINASEVQQHNDVTFTRSAMVTMPVNIGNKRVIDPIFQFAKRRIEQFTNLISSMLKNPIKANKIIRKIAGYIGDGRYANASRLLEAGLVFHPEILTVTQDIFKNKYINENLLKFKRNGQTSYLMPDHSGKVKPGEVFLSEEFRNKKTANGKKLQIGDKVVVNRNPAARIDNFRVLTVKGFLPKSRYGNAIVMNGGESIFYQESDFDIDSIFVATDMSKEEIESFEAVSNLIGVVDIKPSETKDNIWNPIERIRVQGRFAAGKRAIGVIANVQNMYSLLVQNNKALAIDSKGKVSVVDIKEAVKNSGKDKYYLVPKYDSVEMQKFIAPIFQAAVDNAKLDTLSTILPGGKPYSRELLLKELFNPLLPNSEEFKNFRKGFDPIFTAFSSKLSIMRKYLDVMQTFSKDWEEGGISWSYKEQHNAIMRYQNFTRNLLSGEDYSANETLFPNSPLHYVFSNYPKVSLLNGGYLGENSRFYFTDNMRRYHWQTIEIGFKKDINRLDPYQGGSISFERNEQMTDAIIEIFKIKDSHFNREIPTKDSMAITESGSINKVEGYHTKVNNIIKGLNLSKDEQLWFDLKMLNNFDGIQSKGKWKGDLSSEQLKEVLLRDYNTRYNFMTKGKGKDWNQFNAAAHLYPIAKPTFKSRYTPYFISPAITMGTLRKYAEVYNKIYKADVDKKVQIGKGLLAGSSGSLSIGLDPSQVVKTFSGLLKNTNKYLNSLSETSWAKWFKEDKFAEITNRQVAKINELLDKVYGSDIWGDKTVMEFIAYTLVNGVGSRPATRAMLDFNTNPITVEEGEILVHELEHIYRQLKSGKVDKKVQSMWNTKELMSRHPILSNFYAKLEKEYDSVNKLAADVLLDTDIIETASFGIAEPGEIINTGVKIPGLRSKLNSYYKLFKKYMTLKMEDSSKEDINAAKKDMEDYLSKNPEVKDKLDLMEAVATIHQQVDEKTVVGQSILKHNPGLNSLLINEGIIKENFKNSRQYYSKVIEFAEKSGIKFPDDLTNNYYKIKLSEEVKQLRKEYERKTGKQINITNTNLLITINRMDSVANRIYDFDKETYEVHIKPRKEELKIQIIANLTGVVDKKGEVIDEKRASKIADKLLSFIPDKFRRIERYFPWLRLDFEIERHYSVWNLDQLKDDIRSGKLSLDDWMSKPPVTGFLQPRKIDWREELERGGVNIPWDVPEVLRVRLLASMNMRKVASIRKHFSDLFKQIREGILEGKFTKTEEELFGSLERYLTILKYDLQGIPFARKAIKEGKFNGSFSNEDYLDSEAIKEWQKTFFTQVDMISKIYKNLRSFAFIGLSMPVSVRNVMSQGIVFAGSDLGFKRVLSSITSLIRRGAKSNFAIVPEKVNGELVTPERIFKDLALDHDDIIAQVKESQLPTMFTVNRDAQKKFGFKVTNKIYKLSGALTNWSLDHLNWGAGFTKTFLGLPLSFRGSEIELNRLGHAVAAVKKQWEIFEKRGVEITPEQKYEKALEFAREKIRELDFDYSLLNRPQMFRHKMGGALFVFRSFTWSQVSTMYKWARDFKEYRSFENFQKLAWFTLLQGAAVMASTAIGLQFVRFFDWALADVFKDFYRLIKWVMDDDEAALREIGFGIEKEIEKVMSDLGIEGAAGRAIALPIAAINHVFTGVVPDIVNLFMFAMSEDDEVKSPFQLNRLNRFQRNLWQAGGLKQPMNINKFRINLQKVLRQQSRGKDFKHPERTMETFKFFGWWILQQQLGVRKEWKRRPKKLEFPPGLDLGLPNINIEK